MVMVPQAEQTATGGQDFDQALESVKVERNTRGTTFSYRVARHEGETWEDVFRTVDMVYNALTRRFPDNR
jgi:hypothetical protein